MIQIFNGKAMAQIEQPCAFKGIRLIVDMQKRKLVVYVPFKGNVIQYDSIGLSINDWMVCTPYEECSMVATGLNIPYIYGDRPFFDDALHGLCDRLVKQYNLNVA